jgi:hypothetical protein
MKYHLMDLLFIMIIIYFAIIYGKMKINCFMFLVVFITFLKLMSFMMVKMVNLSLEDLLYVVDIVDFADFVGCLYDSSV